MTIRLYNSLTRKIEELAPRTPSHIDMFVCGPTVYDRIHIGNARTFTIFDVVAKWLRYRGLEVNYIQNITDIDDRIIARANEHSENPLEYARQFDDAFRADMQGLGNDSVSQYARASDHVPQVIAQVKTLIKNGNAYLIEGDGWYFDLTTFPDYGKLSGRTGIQANDAVSRIDDSEKKRNTGDFCIWKLSKPNEPVWEDSTLGAGRPGWHIEDTAITEHYFGPQYDLHGGGMDLKFPHHEAEIAQQEAASGKVPFVKQWMHVGFLENKSEKMSKSLDNFLTLHEALQQYEPAVLRFYFLSNHYRAPLDFNEDSLTSAEASYFRIREMRNKVALVQFNGNESMEGPISGKSVQTEERLTIAMDSDFNTPEAFAALFEFVSVVSESFATRSVGRKDISKIIHILNLYDKLFGIVPHDMDYTNATHIARTPIPEHVQKLVDERELARGRKDWIAADAGRGATGSAGYTIDDTPYGPFVKKK